MSINNILNATGVPRSTVSMLKKKLSHGDEEGLHRMVANPNNRGRSTLLSKEEEDMVTERIKIAAARGFATDYNCIRTMMARIAADGSLGWPNGIPCSDTIHAFRAQRDIACLIGKGAGRDSKGEQENRKRTRNMKPRSVGKWLRPQQRSVACL